MVEACRGVRAVNEGVKVCARVWHLEQPVAGEEEEAGGGSRSSWMLGMKQWGFISRI